MGLGKVGQYNLFMGGRIKYLPAPMGAEARGCALSEFSIRGAHAAQLELCLDPYPCSAGPIHTVVLRAGLSQDCEMVSRLNRSMVMPKWLLSLFPCSDPHEEFGGLKRLIQRGSIMGAGPLVGVSSIGNVSISLVNLFILMNCPLA